MADINDNSLKGLDAKLPPVQSLEELKSQIDLPDGIVTKPGAVNFPEGTTGINTVPTFDDIANMVDSIGSVRADNPDLRSKVENFDAGIDGYQYERYYNHPLVKDLGISPFRDNESLYNKNSHLGHELIRALPQFGNQLLDAVGDAATWGNVTDQEAARNMERAMSLGSSSKEGFTGFTTNLFLNSAYTFGIIGEMVAEDLLLAGVTALSGGLLGKATVPMMFARGVRATDKISDSLGVAKNVYRTLENLKDAEKAKSYFNKAVKGTGQFLNPLEATTQWIKGIDNVNDLTDLAKVSKGFGSFYGDVRQLRYAWGEASLEGGFVQNELEKELYADFLKENNGQPLTQEQKDIVKNFSKQAGVTLTMQNIPALLYSNKITLDGVFKRFGKYVSDDVVKFEGKILEGSFNRNNNKLFDFVEDNWKGRFKQFKNPKNYAKAALFYTKDNLAEGLQETYQESMSGANKEYYLDLATKGSAIEGQYLSYVADNLKKMTTTAEGGEVFLSGFLMGTLAGGGARLVGSIFNKQNFLRYANSKKFDKIKQEDEREINKILETLNEFSTNFDKHLKDDLYLLIDQHNISKAKKEAAENKDVKAYYDLKDASFFKQVSHVLKKGGLEPFVEQLQDYKQLSPEDVEKDFGTTYDEFLGAIDSAITNARRMEKRWEVIQEKMPNPFPKSNMFYKGWEEAQNNFLFMHNTFDRHLERITSLMNEIQADSNLAELPTSDFSNLYDYGALNAEIKLLNEEIDIGTGIKDATVKKDINYKKQKLNHLKNFREAVRNLETFFELDENGDYLLNKEEGKKAYTKAKDVYRRYLRHLAKDKYYAFDDALDNSFEKLVDLYLNKADAKKMNDTINRLIDPSYFTNFAKRMSEMFSLQKTKEQEKWKDSLKKYQKSNYVQHGILRPLYENWKVYIDPEDIKSLVEDGDLPDTFYKVTEKLSDEIEELEMNSDDYREVITYLRSVVKDLLDLPIAEKQASPYDLKNRVKDKNDERKYNDLATQFKFDKSSTVSVKELLTAIVSSDYASVAEIRLAESLLKTVSDSDRVAFVEGLSQPFMKDDEGYKIDARYASYDYKKGVFPLEVIILKSELARRIEGAVNTDSEFKGKLEKMFNAATSYWETTKKGALPLGLSFTEVEGDNVANLEEFALEAMTNSSFQTFLAEVPYTSSVTNTSLWQAFVDSVLNVLKKLSVTKSGDLLNEALAVVTTKIDDIAGIDTTSTTGTKKPIPGAKVDKKFELITDAAGNIVVSEDAINHLLGLGWTFAGLKKLSYVEQVAVANANLTPQAYADVEGEVIAEETTKALLSEVKKTVENELNALLENVKSLDALKDAEEAVNSFLMTETKAKREDGRPFTYYDVLENTGESNVPKYIKNKIDKARRELITKFTVDDVKKGAVVKLKTGPILEVIEVTEDGYIGQSADASKPAMPFTFEDIKLLKTEAMNEFKLDDVAGVPDDAEIITDTDTDLSDQSVQNADAEVSDDDMEAAIENKPDDNINDIANIC
jgi:hypothetical protein